MFLFSLSLSELILKKDKSMMDIKHQGVSKLKYLLMVAIFWLFLGFETPFGFFESVKFFRLGNSSALE